MYAIVTSVFGIYLKTKNQQKIEQHENKNNIWCETYHDCAKLSCSNIYKSSSRFWYISKSLIKQNTYHRHHRQYEPNVKSWCQRWTVYSHKIKLKQRIKNWMQTKHVLKAIESHVGRCVIDVRHRINIHCFV